MNWLKIGKIAALIILPLPVSALIIFLYKRGHLKILEGLNK